MSEWSLRFLGIGSAQAVELGNASAVIEHQNKPWLMIDCGSEALTAYRNIFNEWPNAMFITHAHLDHVGGLERVFYGNYFDPARRGKIKLYVPAPLVPVLQERVANYPNVIAEGGANFWDAFQLIPVARGFWHRGVWVDVFAVRHHAFNTAFGLALKGALLFTGDTRPIPEVLRQFAASNELIAHDCGLHANPSHTGVEDLRREYSTEQCERLLLYHVGSLADADAIRAKGFKVAECDHNYPLAEPQKPEWLLDVNWQIN